jgi:hypothetical protein
VFVAGLDHGLDRGRGFVEHRRVARGQLTVEPQHVETHFGAVGELREHRGRQDAPEDHRTTFAAVERARGDEHRPELGEHEPRNLARLFRAAAAGLQQEGMAGVEALEVELGELELRTTLEIADAAKAHAAVGIDEVQEVDARLPEGL